MTGGGRRLLLLDEAAEYLGIRPRTVEKLAHTGRLPFVKLGRATRYEVGDLDAFIERNRRRNRRGIVTAPPELHQAVTATTRRNLGDRSSMS